MFFLPQKLYESCWPAEIMVPRPAGYMEMTEVEKKQMHNNNLELGTLSRSTEIGGATNDAFDHQEEKF